MSRRTRSSGARRSSKSCRAPPTCLRSRAPSKKWRASPPIGSGSTCSPAEGETMSLFRDRSDAGRRLAAALGAYAHRPDVLVLALPRGGVPVAFEVARALDAPLDLFLVRKLGLPGQEELAMGAIASGGVRVLNEDVVNGLRIPESVIDRVAQH